MRLHEPPFVLREMKVEVTHASPLVCIHCSSDASPSCRREMSEEGCTRIVQEAITMGVQELTFSGGEPLIWPPIYNVVGAASRGRLRVVVYTSGNVSKVNQAMLSLKAGGVERCVFSLFGASEGAHERITHVGRSFQKTLTAITAARRAGLTAEIHFVPLSQNLHELDGVARLAGKRGVARISVLRFVPQGRGQLIKRHTLSKLQNLTLKRTVERLRKDGFDVRTGSPYKFLMLNNQPKCCSAIDRLIVGPDLRIYPCDAFKQIEAEELVGTKEYSCLDDYSLRDCWEKSPYLAAIREYLTTPFAPPCDTCSALDRCLSGCLAQKVVAHGTLDERADPMCLRKGEVE